MTNPFKSTKYVWALFQYEVNSKNFSENLYEVFDEKETCFKKYPVRWRVVEYHNYATNYVRKFEAHKKCSGLALRKIPFITKKS